MSEASRPSPAEGGERFGRYILGDDLGQGAMGRVREAMDTVLQRRVAVKLLTHPGAASLVRFLQEAQWLARLRHPGICQVFDTGHHQGQAFIAMELVEGGTLHAVGPTLPLKERIQLIAQVSEALAVAHRQDLIHRDLKPSNILLRPLEGGGFQPVICDFGLAKDLTSEGYTQIEVGLGTPPFMAPEQLIGEGHPVGPALDIYGVGATLHWLLYGHPPGRLGPTGASPKVLSKCIGSGEPVPVEILQILGTCLSHLPEDRYPSAALLAEDLTRALDGRPLLLKPLSLHRRAYRWVRRNRHLSAIAGIAMVIAGGGVVWGVQSNLYARRQARSAQRFALVSKDIEHGLAIEHMRPLHDLRPGIARLQSRMKEIETLMASEGRSAQAPGHFALGRGYLLLGRPQESLRELEAAWRGGYQIPDVAFALGRANVERFWQADRETGFLGDPVEVVKAQRRYRDDGAYYFRLSTGQSLVSPPLAEAWLARVFYNTQAGLDKTQEALRLVPWDMEAQAYEAGTMARMGYDRMTRGHEAEAWEWFQKAEAAAEKARHLGRSFPWAYQPSINWRVSWATWKLDQGKPDPKILDDLAALVAARTLLNPEDPDAVSNEMVLAQLRAMTMLAARKDPTPVLKAAIQALQAWQQSHPPTPGLRSDRMILQWLLGRAAMLRGEDPSAQFQEALKDPGHTNYRMTDYLAALLNDVARSEMALGHDPEATILRNLDGLGRMNQRVENFTYRRLEGEAHLLRAYRLRNMGMDPSGELSAAEQALQRSRTLNPISAATLRTRGELTALRAAVAKGRS